MTTRQSRIGTVLYNTESTFAADSSTFGTRLLTLGMVDVSKIRRRTEQIGILQQRLHEGVAPVLTHWELGELFSIDLLLTGHGGTAAGALTPTDLATLLGYAIGGLYTSDVGGVAAAGGTATGIEVASGATIAIASLLRAGIPADTRGGGQFYAVGATGANPELTLLTAMPAALNASDVIYATQMIYPIETGAETMQSLRFRLLTANEHWDVFGCAPVRIAISQTNPAEIPRITIGFSGAWARPVSGGATFPSATATAAKDGVMIGNGSLFAQVVGTTTRQTFPVRTLSIDIQNEVAQLRGLGGTGTGQTVDAVRRLRCGLKMTATVDAPATGTRTIYDAWAARQFWHLLWTASAEDGKAVGLYIPNARFESQPVQVSSSDDLNAVSCTWEALTTAVSTNDRTLSSWRLCLG